MRIACGFEHAGFPLKEIVLNTLREGHEPLDLGTFSSEPVDYHDGALVVTRANASFTGKERYRRRLAKVAAIERDGLEGGLSKTTPEGGRV